MENKSEVVFTESQVISILTDLWEEGLLLSGRDCKSILNKYGLVFDPKKIA